MKNFIEVTYSGNSYQVGGAKYIVNVNHIAWICGLQGNIGTTLILCDGTRITTTETGDELVALIEAAQAPLPAIVEKIVNE